MRTLIITSLLCLVSVVAQAQTVQKLGPTDSVRFTWPAAVVSADTLDAPDGYRVKAISPTQTGVVIRSWDVAGAATTTWTMTAAQVPTGLFNVTIHPYNAAGEAPGSNPVGPFGKAMTPKSLTGVVGSVVAGGSASLEKPASGAETFTSTRMSTASTTQTSPVGFVRLYAYPMVGNVWWSNLSEPGMPSGSVWPTSSQLPKPTPSR